MRFGHAGSDGGEIIFVERFDEAKDAFVLSYDVMASAENDFRKSSAMGKKLRETHIAQGGNSWQKRSENLYALFALCAALIVFAAGMPVFDHSVANNHGNSGRQGKLRVRQGPAVKKKSVAGTTKTGCELVHDADARADEFDFSALAELGNVEKPERAIGGGKKCAGNGNFQCSGGTESGASWNAAEDRNVRATDGNPEAMEHQGDPGDIIGPMIPGTKTDRAQV